MSLMEIGGLLLLVMIFLLSGGVWIAMTLAIVGWVGQAFFTTTLPGKNLFSAFWETAASWELAALPLFIWMGEILYRTRLSEQMFDGLAPWLSRVPGRLMHTTILGCGIFGSVSGSSAATCATIAKVALPELERRGYNRDIALGSLAAAGGLGILIPPSITMVVYAVAADASVIRLFLAGFFPGFLLMALFSGYIMVWAWLNPGKTPQEDTTLGFGEKLYRSRHLIPCVLLIVFIVVMIGMVLACVRAPGLNLPIAVFAVVSMLVVGTIPAVSPRYLMSITPFAVYFGAQAFALLPVPKRAGVWVSAVVLGLFVLHHSTLFPKAIRATDATNRQMAVAEGPESAWVKPVWNAVEKFTHRDDVVGFWRSRLMTLYTERPSIQTYSVEVMSHTADYYVMRKEWTFFQPLVSNTVADEMGWVKVWEDEHWVLWQIRHLKT